MGFFNKPVPVSGLVFEHGLSKQQVAKLAAADVSGHETDTWVLRSCGINDLGMTPDEEFKLSIVECILHPDWEYCNRYLANGLTDLVISPSDDFDRPAELKADVAQVLIDLAGRYVQLAEDLRGRRFAARAAQILAMVAQFGMFGNLDLDSLPEPLLHRLGRLFPSEASLASLGLSTRDLVSQFRRSGNPDGPGFFPDPWDQVEYRYFEGGRWSTKSLVYGVEVVDRVGKDAEGLQLAVDPWVREFYVTRFAGNSFTSRETYEHELRSHIRSMNATGRHGLVLAMAEFAASAKHAVSPDEEGPFWLPAIPVPAPDEMDLAYRLNEVTRRWILVASSDKAAEAAALIVGRGEETTFLAAERALVSVADRAEPEGWVLDSC